MKNREFALFMLFILIFCFTCVSTAPIVQPLHKFFAHAVANKCDLPRNIKPFTPSARGWFFLSDPLNQCDAANATFETNTLCAEIFENFINTTCTPIDPKISIPKISYKLSSEVCADFANSGNIVPKIDGYIGGKLSDRTVCQLACASQYEILCKVLLWSYQIRHHIETAAENQNALNPPAQSQIDLKPVTQDPNDLKSSNTAQGDTPQEESEGKPNDVSEAPIIAGVESKSKILKDPTLKNIIAEKVFDNQRRLIPDFVGHEEEKQGQTASPQMKVEVVSSSTKDLPISSVVDSNKKTDNVEVAKSDEIVNEHGTSENRLSSPRNDDINQDIEVTGTKNQNTTAESTTPKNTGKDKFKAKLMEKLKKHETFKNNAVSGNNSTNPNPETTVGENTIQVATNEKLSTNEGNQPETKDSPSVEKNKIDHVDNDPGNELAYETLKDDKEGENGEDNNLNTERIVSSSSSTTQNPVKDKQLQSGLDVSVASNTKVSKSSDQLNSPSLTDNKDTTLASKAEVKSTVEIQGKSISLAGGSSDVPSLETTTLVAELESMNDANEILPPVQGQDQFNDLENGDTEGEYDRPDYAPDGALPPSTENRKVIAQDFFSTSEKTSVFNDQQNEFSRLYEDDFIPKNIAGQVSEDIRRIPPFPEEEDGHFFFYFLTVILILMIGYLLFHNKQKIIALIVEGRHERRRRSYGAGYKKLETK